VSLAAAQSANGSPPEASDSVRQSQPPRRFPARKPYLCAPWNVSNLAQSGRGNDVTLQSFDIAACPEVASWRPSGRSARWVQPPAPPQRA